MTSDLPLQFGIKNVLALKLGEALVPEPTTLGLMALGAMGLRGRRRKGKS